MIYAQQCPAAIYSASAVESATQACFFLFHEIRLDSSKWQVPLVIFLSNLHPAESEYEKPLRIMLNSHGYHKPTLVVPLRYFRIL